MNTRHAKKRIGRPSLKPIAAVMLLTFGVSAFAPAYASSKTENTPQSTSMTQYIGWGDPDMAKLAVNSGRALIEHLRTASSLLSQGKTTQARNALIASHEFASAIDRMMPFLVVTQQMKSTSDQIMNEKIDVYTADFLPIYASLNDLQVYAPKVATKTRAMVKTAEQHAKNGKRKQATEILKRAEDIVSNQTVYLPVSYVEQQVNAALYAVNLPKPDTKAANTAVSHAIDSLVDVVNTVVKPAA